MIRRLLGFIALLATAARAAEPAATVALRAEFARTLTVLVDSLERQQVIASGTADRGALQCPQCHILHTRAAEAVWPMAMQFVETGDERHLRAARALATWLFRQQQPDGSWKETPEEWTGTTTDQLLMLVLAFSEWPIQREVAVLRSQAAGRL